MVKQREGRARQHRRSRRAQLHRNPPPMLVCPSCRRRLGRAWVLEPGGVDAGVVAFGAGAVRAADAQLKCEHCATTRYVWRDAIAIAVPD